jgi:hypothetical protein
MAYKNNYDDTYSSGDVSAFNEGMLQIGRLNNIWTRCITLKTNDSLSEWSLELDAAWDELRYDAVKLDAKYEELIDNINAIINQFYSEREEILGKSTLIKSRPSLRKLLHKKEQLLRTIQNECGKGARYESATELDL